VTEASDRTPTRRAQVAIVIGVALLILVAVIAKDELVGSASTPGPAGAAEAPQVTLDRALAANRPTLAFYHSLTCASCVEMMAIVEQVHAEFVDTIALVDVNVYEDRNQALVERSRILAIPTVVLIDRTGKEESFLGVIEADQLRRELRALVGGD
jgi:thiol-disulfide isomerase/thioredoxin